MGKIKTHKASSKRFSLTGSGKIKMNHNNHRHNLGIKTSKRKRGLRKGAILSEFKEKDAKIDDLRCFANYLESENNKLKTNLKNTAGVLTAAARALQEGLNDY